MAAGLKATMTPFSSSMAIRHESCQFDQPTILADGTITFCVLGCRHFEDFSLGNVSSMSILEAWNSGAMRAIRESARVDDIPVCSGCEYKYLCGGICPFSRRLRQLTLDELGLPDCPRYGAWISRAKGAANQGRGESPGEY